MGDRYDRRGGRHGPPHLQGKPPPRIIAWGLGEPATMGHNNGPPLEDEQPGYLWRRYRWKKAHAEAWKAPSLGILKFRAARAESAGVSYRDYMLALLDTGRHLQRPGTGTADGATTRQVRAAWEWLAARVAPDAGVAAITAAGDALLASYTGPGRHYHGLAHIASLLDLLDRHGSAAIAPDALRLAILFHDVVHEPARGDNEAASAALATAVLADLGASPELAERIAALIMATRHAGHIANGDTDAVLLRDLDLAILAADAAAYDAYAAAIRREYAAVPDDRFNAGRSPILVGFLARPHIYVTVELGRRWESHARRNIAREIATLAGG